MAPVLVLTDDRELHRRLTKDAPAPAAAKSVVRWLAGPFAQRVAYTLAVPEPG